MPSGGKGLKQSELFYPRVTIIHCYNTLRNNLAKPDTIEAMHILVSNIILP